MSENQSPAASPAGWYPDGSDSGQLRWWNGADWTEHVSSPYSSAAPTQLTRPALPADRPIYSVFIWLIVLLPLVAVALLFAWRPNFDYLSDPRQLSNPYAMITPGYFLVLAGSWIAYGLSAVFAWRDVVWLRKQGVVRPFPWPWVFLYSAVYVIGRSIIVHRVAAPRGRAPIWVFIVVVALSLIISLAWSFSLIAGVMANIPSYGSYGG